MLYRVSVFAFKEFALTCMVLSAKANHASAQTTQFTTHVGTCIPAYIDLTCIVTLVCPDTVTSYSPSRSATFSSPDCWPGCPDTAFRFTVIVIPAFADSWLSESGGSGWDCGSCSGAGTRTHITHSNKFTAHPAAAIQPHPDILEMRLALLVYFTLVRTIIVQHLANFCISFPTHKNG